MIGQTLSHYEVLERIGEGGMGVVYKARDTLLGRLVALKTLPSSGTADPDRRARLLREARAASALHHPNIVAVYDLLHHEGSDVIVMELVTGRTLDQAVAGKPLREVLGYARQIADALAKAHAAGIVHRDLKPSNVMVDEGGTVRVLDFGLARLGPPVGTVEFDSESARPTAEATGTAEGRIVGTLAYMSPEQAEGKKADARSDVFSFGAVLYEMVTGRMAFRGDSAAATLAAVLEHDPPPPRELVPGLPADLEKLVQRCLRKDPAKRFQSMGDVALDLDEVAAGLDTAPEAGSRGLSRLKWRWWLFAGAAALASVAGVAFVAWRARPNPAPARPRITQLTSYPGSERYASFSPDGTHVAFVWNGGKQDNSDIYVKAIDGLGPPLRLTANPAPDFYPSWSPDGRWIAFRRTVRLSGVTPHVDVLVVPALGGPERKVASVALSPAYSFPSVSWTPDGKWLATADADPAEGNGIFLLPLEQGEKRRLTSNRENADTGPAVSPDGRWLAYGSNSGPWTCDLHLLPLDADSRPAGPSRRLTHDGLVLYGIAWSADGREIVYAASRSGGNVPYLWRLPISGRGTTERIDLVGPRALAPAVSRAGYRLVYSRGNSDSDVWRIEVPGPPRPLLQSTKLDAKPDLSPDGKQIAFCSNRSSEGLEVFVSQVDGSSPVQLTDRIGREQCSPRWSPDGRWIAFDSQTESGDWDVLVVDAAGGPPRRLAATPHYESLPAWSRDGRFVYFSSDRSGRFEVWRVPAHGGEPEQITDDGGVTSLESYDGRTLFYVKTRAGLQPLFARTLGLPGERKILEEIVGRDLFGVDETGVVFVARGERPGTTYLLRHLDVATGRTRVVAPLNILPTLGLTVSRDGRTILFGATKPPNDDLFLIENFR